MLESWISKYTEGVKMKPTRNRFESPHMNKEQETTYEERIEIVQFTMAMI